MNMPSPAAHAGDPYYQPVNRQEAMEDAVDSLSLEIRDDIVKDRVMLAEAMTEYLAMGNAVIASAFAEALAAVMVANPRPMAALAHNAARWYAVHLARERVEALADEGVEP